MDVAIFFGDIKIADPDHEILWRVILPDIIAKPAEPIQFISELVGINRHTLGDIGIDQNHITNAGLNKTGLICGILRQRSDHFFGLMFAEDGDAVIFFLTPADDFIARLSQVRNREIESRAMKVLGRVKADSAISLREEEPADDDA